MRVLFAGTPQFAVPALIMAAERFEVCGVLSAPDRPSGRGRRVLASPVRMEAERLGLTVVAPAQLDAPAMQAVSALSADILVVVAYGLIFTQRFLDLFPSGAFNVHPSLLPRHRGAAPIPASILAGDHETGVTIQRVVLRMDSGPILRRRVRILEGTETTAGLTTELAEAGADLLMECLYELIQGTAEELVQVEEEATYCSKVNAKDGQIDWGADDASTIQRMVRAFNPWPRAHCRLGKRRLNLLSARVVGEEESGPPGQVARVDSQHGILINTTRGILGVSELQLEGRRAMDWKAFANGYVGLSGVQLA